MIMLKVDDRTIMKRHASQEIMAMRVDANTFGNLNRGRTIEFHFAVEANTNLLWLDIDPKDLFPWEETKAITADLLKAMESIDEVDITKTELRFSGKSGFHILSHIAHPLNIDEARMVVKRVAEQYVSGRADPRITTGTTQEAEGLRIDYSTMREQGGLRVAHSLAYPTGLMCMPINPSSLSGFEKEMAKIAPITAQGTTQEELEQFEPLRKQYNVSVDEIHAVGKWLNVFQDRITGEDIGTILSLRDRLTSPVFHNLAAKIMGRLTPDPEELDRGLTGLEMLRGLPKYRSSYADIWMQSREWDPSNLEKFVISPEGKITGFDTSEFPHHIDYFNDLLETDLESLPFDEGWSTGSRTFDGRELALNIADDKTPEEILRLLPPEYLDVKTLYITEQFGSGESVVVRKGEDALSAWENRFRPGPDVVMAAEGGIEEFMKKHKLVPYIEDIVQEYQTPLLANIPPKVIQAVFDMYDKLDPPTFQKYVEVILGLRIPVKSLDEFVERLKWAHSSLSREGSRDGIRGWSILGQMEKYGTKTKFDDIRGFRGGTQNV